MLLEACIPSMGSFDPLTNGPLDLIARGAKIVDELVVAYPSMSITRPTWV